MNQLILGEYKLVIPIIIIIGISIIDLIAIQFLEDHARLADNAVLLLLHLDMTNAIGLEVAGLIVEVVRDFNEIEFILEVEGGLDALAGEYLLFGLGEHGCQGFLEYFVAH
jgi:hypothetical protein